MKTAEEWANDIVDMDIIGDKHSGISMSTILVKKIQLDAWEAGINEAIKLMEEQFNDKENPTLISALEKVKYRRCFKKNLYD